jgi:hypothetical protein
MKDDKSGGKGCRLFGRTMTATIRRSTRGIHMAAIASNAISGTRGMLKRSVARAGSQKVADFFDEHMRQLFDLERVLIDHVSPYGGQAL